MKFKVNYYFSFSFKIVINLVNTVITFSKMKIIIYKLIKYSDCHETFQFL